MTPAANTGYVQSVEELDYLADMVISSGLPIALDCELGYEGEDRGYKNTSPSLHPEENLFVGYSFTNDPSWGRYVPVGHDDTRYNLDPVAAARALWRMMSTGRCVVHNADAEERNCSRFAVKYLASDPEYGPAVTASNGYFPLLSDTMMEAHALAKFQKLKLKYLSKQVLSYDQTELEALFPNLPKNKKHTLRFNVLDPSDPEIFGYACDDVIQGLRLHQRHYSAVKDNDIYQIEMAVWPVVFPMEDDGLAVDWDYIDAGAREGRQFLLRMQAALHEAMTARLGRMIKVNLGSPKQLREVLYNSQENGGLGLATHIMTKGKADGSGKQMSTSATALKNLAADPIIRALLDYRGMSKLLGTYLEPFRTEYGWCECGRAHCHLLPHGTVTGRFSSSDFNYQNLPKKYHYALPDGTEFNFNFRNAVIAPPGWWGMGFDLSQAELRVIAAEAGEESMLQAFARGEDVHALTASRLLGISLDEVYAGGELMGREFPAASGGYRPFGKTMNFALVYQLSPRGLADRLGCSLEEAVDHYERFFTAYPAISRWTRETVQNSKITGYTMSRMGRRHPIWAYSSDKSWIYAGGERTAGNAPIQGGVADLMKVIMVRCDRALAAAGLKDRVRMIMNIHDALEFYVREDVPPQLVVDTLTPAVIFDTPWSSLVKMEAEWHLWRRWGEPTEIALDERNQIVGMGSAIDIGMEDEDEGGDEMDDEGAVLAGPAGGAVGAVSAVPGLGGSPGGLDADTDHGVPGGPVRPVSGTVIVRLSEMPDMAVLERFARMLWEFPGPNVMLLDTPMGRTHISAGTALSPADEGQISLALGGARVVWDAASVSSSVLAEGLAL